MGFLISLLAPKVGARFAGLIVYGGIILIIVGSILWYGRTRYHAGVKATDEKWVEAGKKLEKQVAKAAGGADTKAAERVEVQNEIVAMEKERLDAAEQNGDSALDVLFGGGVR